jgi:N-acetylglucosamine malate deacetylase 1
MLVKIMFKKVVVLSPHTDDGELGAGGTIAKLTEKNISVDMIAFSWCDEENNIKAVKKAADILSINKLEILEFKRRIFPRQRQDILQVLYDYNKDQKPDLVLTPTTTDLHQDHSVVTQEAMRAFKSSSILGYEMPWNNIQITTNSFIPLEENHVQRKISALQSYNTQLDRYYFNEEYFRSILRMRGTQIQSKYAEAFEVIKFVPKL